MKKSEDSEDLQLLDNSSTNETNIWSKVTNDSIKGEINSIENDIQKYFKSDKNSFICLYNDCRKRFPDSTNIKRHIKRHLGIKPFKCQYKECDYRSVKSSNLKRHINCIHQFKGDLKCNECKTSFKTKFDLNSHKTRAHPKAKSDNSDQKLKNSEDSEELQSFDKSSENDTNICSKVTHNSIKGEINSNENEIQKYIKCDNNEVVCLYTDCDKRFPDSKYIKRHIRRHLSIKSVKGYKRCDYKCEDSSHLKRHVSLVNRFTANLKCNECNSSFKTRFDLNSHKSRVHQKIDEIQKYIKVDKNSFICLYTDCSKQFNYLYQLKRHIRRHVGVKPFKCQFKGCDYKCESYSHLKRHIISVHRFKGDLKCNECNTSFKTLFDLKTHKSRAHPKFKRFKCDFKGCDYKSEESYVLKRHMSRVHRLKDDHKCNECNTSFKTHFDLRTHKSRAHQKAKSDNSDQKLKTSEDSEDLQSFDKSSVNEANICSKMTKNSIEGEINSNEDQIQKYSKLDIKGSLCLYKNCGKRFIGSSNLENHIRRHLGIKPFKCQYKECDYKCVTSSDLNRHISSVHQIIGDLKCKECKTSFKTKFDLYSHKTRAHPKANSDKSDQKIKKSEDSEELQSLDNSSENETNICSKVTHNSIKGEVSENEFQKYFKNDKKGSVCLYNDCGKVFRYSYDLENHIRRHLGIKPFKCQYKGCDYKCVTSADLNQHISSVHQFIDDLKCNECKTSFKTSFDLRTHKSRVHPKTKSDNSDQKLKKSEDLQSMDKKSENETNICSKVTHNSIKGEINSNENEIRKYIKRDNNEVICLYSDCGKRFPNSKSINRHIRRHLGIKSVNGYKRCDYKSEDSSHLKRHISRVHRFTANLKCNECYSSFKTRFDLNSHKSRVHQKIDEIQKYIKVDKNSFICLYTDCGKQFNYLYQLKRHIRRHVGVKPFKCQFKGCDYKCESYSHLKRHIISVHRFKGDLKCNKCNTSFKTLFDLKTHKSRAHPKFKRFKCDFNGCDYKSEESYVLKRHMSRVHRLKDDLKCNECNTSFKTPFDLRTHKSSAHQKAKSDNSDQNVKISEDLQSLDNSSEIEANICSKVTHHSIKGEINSNENEIQKYIKSDKNNFICLHTDCGKRFSNLKHIKKHIKRHLGIKPFKCRYEGCDYNCVDSHGLDRHINRNHQFRANLKCNDCNTSFTTKFDLNTHKSRAHPKAKCDNSDQKLKKSEDYEGLQSLDNSSENEKNISSKINENEIQKYIKRDNNQVVCLYKNCGKCFPDSKNIKRHILRHLGIKPFKCQYKGCDYNCVDSGALNRHIRRHLGIKTFKCEYKGCDYKCVDSGSLKRHISGVHQFKVDLKCNECKTSFKTKFDLNTHKLKAHPKT